MPTSDGDDDALPAALAAVGMDPSWVVWDDPDLDPTVADLAVLRSTWDYTERRAAFLAWCESVPGLANPADAVRWNTDKTYLLDLAAAGVAVVPSELVRPGGTPHWPDTEFVVKPTVGAGSRGAARFGRGETADAEAHLAGLHAASRTALVQPYQPAVDTAGETALVFFAGGYSHAFVKGPMLTSAAATDASGLFVTERLRPAEPDPAQRRLAEDTLDAAADLLGLDRAELLYARVDVVRAGDGGHAVLELELAEPSLGFRQADPGAPLRFASAARNLLRARGRAGFGGSSRSSPRAKR
jgi:glutathione synthase/RimK-type ligase-like ATP-grasp enzyme